MGKVAEKLIRRVQIRLDGKDWPIVVDNNVMIEVEELTGLNLLYGAQKNLMEPSLKFVRAFIYAALKRAGASYTIEDVGLLIKPEHMPVLYQAIAEAFKAAMPEPEATEEPRPMKAVG